MRIRAKTKAKTKKPRLKKTAVAKKPAKVKKPKRKYGTLGVRG